MKSVIRKSMTRLILFRTAIITLFLVSCKKNFSYRENTSTLFGKWDILTDSSFVGVGLGNHAVTYVGQAGDYFDFKPTGELFVEENGKLNALAYAFTSDSTIIIDSFLDGATETCEISDLSVHNAIISTPISMTPGGVFGKKVHLTR
jgi:hypothetical protein